MIDKGIKKTQIPISSIFPPLPSQTSSRVRWAAAEPPPKSTPNGDTQNLDLQSEIVFAARFSCQHTIN